MTDNTELREATSTWHPLGAYWEASEVVSDPDGTRFLVVARCVTTAPDVALYVRTTLTDRYALVELVDATGFAYTAQVQVFAEPIDAA